MDFSTMPVFSIASLTRDICIQRAVAKQEPFGFCFGSPDSVTLCLILNRAELLGVFLVCTNVGDVTE